MHPRDLGPYGLQMQRLIVLSCVFAAIFITVLSGPRLIPTGYSTTELAQWVVYSPNLILPLGAGTCALVATLRASITRSYTHTWIDTGWFLVMRLYLACYMTLIIACVVMPVLRLSSPIPSLYAHAIVSDTNPILALYPLVALGCVAVLRGSYAVTYLSAIAPLQVLAMVTTDPDSKLAETAVGPLYFLLFAMVNVGMLHWTMTIVRGLDQTRRRAREAERALVSERARGRARARGNGLIHDYVLAALILASSRGIDEDEVRAAADNALSALVPSPPADETVDAVQVRGALAALVRHRRPHWTFTCRMARDDWRIPARVASALCDATYEALNNVRLHAGSDSSDPGKPAQCYVELCAGGGRVSVTISDTGQGFDSACPPKGRHGVKESIVKRMETVGGTAALTSNTDGGTRVILDWADPHTQRFKPRRVIRSAFAWRPHARGYDKDPSRTAWDSKLRAATESRGARMLALVGVIVHVYILAIEISHGAYAHTLPVILALVLIGLSGGALVSPWPELVPSKLVTWGSAAVIGVANLLVLTQVRGSSDWPGWSGWCAGASMFLAALLLMRQRTIEAVVGCLGLVAAVTAWVVIQGRPPILVFSFTIGHIITFIFWFALVSWSGVVTSAIEKSLRGEEHARLERELQVGINTAMAVKLADVSQRVRGTLEAIRDGELTPGLAMEARLLEAELRDEIRAPFFSGTDVVAAARKARSKGVEVLLLDDRGGDGDGHKEAADSVDRLRALIIERATTALDEAVGGQVVVRVCPEGRRWAATILTDAGLSVVEAGQAVEVPEDAVEEGAHID